MLLILTVLQYDIGAAELGIYSDEHVTEHSSSSSPPSPTPPGPPPLQNPPRGPIITYLPQIAWAVKNTQDVILYLWGHRALGAFKAEKQSEPLEPGNDVRSTDCTSINVRISDDAQHGFLSARGRKLIKTLGRPQSFLSCSVFCKATLGALSISERETHELYFYCDHTRVSEC